MREIKFRTNDEDNEKMIYQDGDDVEDHKEDVKINYVPRKHKLQFYLFSVCKHNGNNRKKHKRRKK
jgi:hypothetical protein